MYQYHSRDALTLSRAQKQNKTNNKVPLQSLINTAKMVEYRSIGNRTTTTHNET